jgi:hypothetical protein
VHLLAERCAGGIVRAYHASADIHDTAGLTTAEAEAFHAAHGYNEVLTAVVPEWKKIMWRYLDWVSILIVSLPAYSMCSLITLITLHKRTLNPTYGRS